MKKSLLLSISLLVVVGLVAGTMSVKAAETSLTATVTVQSISISIDSGTVTYGTLESGGTQDTFTLGQTQTVTNNSSVAVALDIKGADVSEGCSWTLAGTPDSEIYSHEFSTDISGSGWTALITDDYKSLATSVSAGGTQDFDLQIGVPSSTTCTNQATIDVTVQATIAS